MTTGTAAVRVVLRADPAGWWRSFAAMLRWQLTSMRLVLPVMIIVQILVAAGFSVGISLFFAEVSLVAGIYLGTGASIIVLILVGLVVAPQLIAAEKEAGTYDFTWSLPVPRSAAVASWVVVSAVVSLPAMVAALTVAAWRFDIGYHISWTVVPATILVLVCGTMIGYALAHAIEKPNVTQVIVQLLAFGILGFTPITYPPENLPDWMASFHQVLPFLHMGVVVRSGLSEGLVSDVWLSYVIVAVWTLVAVAVTAWALGRRK